VASDNLALKTAPLMEGVDDYDKSGEKRLNLEVFIEASKY
jgi:hypothetical protein